MALATQAATATRCPWPSPLPTACWTTRSASRMRTGRPRVWPAEPGVWASPATTWRVRRRCAGLHAGARSAAVLSRDPLEAIDAWVRAFAALPAVDAGRTGVLSVSVGTAAALSMLTIPRAPAVRAVIAASPTHVVWQALGGHGPPPKVSSLTRAGDGLAYRREPRRTGSRPGGVRSQIGRVKPRVLPGARRACQRTGIARTRRGARDVRTGREGHADHGGRARAAC